MKIAVWLREAANTAPGAVGIALDPFDEYALEATLQLKEALPGVHLCAVTVGPDRSLGLLRTAGALGIDDLIWVPSEGANGGSCPPTRALADLATQESWDLLILGQGPATWFVGGDGAELAGRLGWAPLLGVRSLSLRQDRVHATIVEGDGALLEVSATLPCVTTCAKGSQGLRRPDLKGIMAARRKEIRRATTSPETLADPWQVVELTPASSRRRARVLPWNSGAGASAVLEMLRDEAKVL